MNIDHVVNLLGLNMSKKNIIIVILLLIQPIIGMVIDIISPSLPNISKSLHVSNSITQNIISIYLIGYAIGTLVTGFLTDAYGRKVLLRVNYFMFILACVIPIFYQNIYIILFSRLLQGLTIGAVATITRAIFADILSKDQLVKLIILIGTMYGLGPVIGPIIGGELQFAFGWTSIFIFLAISTLIIFIFVFLFIPETNKNMHKLNFSIIKKNVFSLFHNKKYVGLTIIMGCVYSLVIIFHTAAPFIIQDQLKYNVLFYGRTNIFLGLAFLLATFISRTLINKLSFNVITANFLCFISFISFISILLSIFFQNSIVLLYFVSAAMFFTQGFLYPLSSGRGLSLFKEIAGTATAIMYFSNVLISSLIGWAISLIAIKNIFILFLSYFVLIICCCLSYFYLVRNNELK